MKKIIIPFMVLLLILSACGKNNAESVEGKEKEQKPQINSVSIKQEGDRKLVVECKATGDNLEYAYYVLQGDKIVKKNAYNSKSTFDYTVKEPGEYKVRVFLKDKNDKKDIKDTSIVKVK